MLNMTITAVALLATVFCFLARITMAESFYDDEDYERPVDRSNNDNFNEEDENFNAQLFAFSPQSSWDQQRSVVYNLAYTLSCYLGKTYNLFTAFQLTLKYGHYGCYCGVGGKGRVMDSIDRCCKEHDQCYGRAAKAHNTKWTFAQTLTLKYATKCHARKTTCAGNTIGSKACVCDRIFGQCVAKHKQCYKISNARIFVKKWCKAKYTAKN